MMGDSTMATALRLKKRQYIENHVEVPAVGFGNSLSMRGEK